MLVQFKFRKQITEGIIIQFFSFILSWWISHVVHPLNDELECTPVKIIIQELWLRLLRLGLGLAGNEVCYDNWWG